LRQPDDSPREGPARSEGIAPVGRWERMGSSGPFSTALNGIQWLRRAANCVERRGDPLCRAGLGGEFVVATAEVLDEGVPGDQHPRCAFCL